MSNSKTTETETKLISINAALAERGARRQASREIICPTMAELAEYNALGTQIRDLETEKHALIRELPL